MHPRCMPPTVLAVGLPKCIKHLIEEHDDLAQYAQAMQVDRREVKKWPMQPLSVFAESEAAFYAIFCRQIMDLAFSSSVRPLPFRCLPVRRCWCLAPHVVAGTVCRSTRLRRSASSAGCTSRASSPVKTAGSGLCCVSRSNCLRPIKCPNSPGAPRPALSFAQELCEVNHQSRPRACEKEWQQECRLMEAVMQFIDIVGTLELPEKARENAERAREQVLRQAEKHQKTQQEDLAQKKRNERKVRRPEPCVQV